MELATVKVVSSGGVSSGKPVASLTVVSAVVPIVFLPVSKLCPSLNNSVNIFRLEFC